MQHWSLENRRSFILAMIGVFFAALAARLIFLFVRGATEAPDSADYLLLARNLLAHGRYSLDQSLPFSPSIRRAPLYPFFLAAMIWLRGAYSASTIAVVQIVLDSLTAVGVFCLTRFLVSSRGAILAGLFYGIYPGALVLSSKLISEPLFTFIFVYAIFALSLGWSSDRVRLTTLAGLLLGLAILCRPIALLTPPIFFLLSWTLPDVRRRFRHGIFLCAAAALVVLPWTLRCSLAAGQVVAVQSAGSVGFYVPSLVDQDQRDEAQLWPYFLTKDPYGQRLAAARTPAEMLEADRYGAQQAGRNIMAQPGKYLRSRLRTYPYLFITSFDGFTGVNQSWSDLLAHRAIGSLLLKLSMLLVFSALPLLLGLLGLLFIQRRIVAALCAGVWLYTLLIHLPMWIEYRFWIPAMPFLLVSAATAAAICWNKFIINTGREA